jgi:hypothetical protein
MSKLTQAQIRANQNNKWFAVPNLPPSAYVQPKTTDYLRTLPRQAPRGFMEGSSESLLGQAVVSQSRSKDALMMVENNRFESERFLEQALGREYIVPRKKRKNWRDEYDERNVGTYINPQEDPYRAVSAINAQDKNAYENFIRLGRQAGIIDRRTQSMVEHGLRTGMFDRNVFNSLQYIFNQRGIGGAMTAIDEMVLRDYRISRGEPEDADLREVDDAQVFEEFLREIYNDNLSARGILEHLERIAPEGFEDGSIFSEAEQAMRITAEEQERRRDPFTPAPRPPTIREAYEVSDRDVAEYMERNPKVGRQARDIITRETIDELIGEIAFEETPIY